MYLAANIRGMKLNLFKTKIISFNFTKKWTFEPKCFLDEQLIDVVQEIKLLGVTITSNSKLDSNTQELIKKTLVPQTTEFTECKQNNSHKFYKLFCYSALESCAQVWAGALIKKNSHDIERVLKNAYRIIYGKN